jgi:hypothetical protein
MIANPESPLINMFFLSGLPPASFITDGAYKFSGKI